MTNDNVEILNFVEKIKSRGTLSTYFLIDPRIGNNKTSTKSALYDRDNENAIELYKFLTFYQTSEFSKLKDVDDR